MIECAFTFPAGCDAGYLADLEVELANRYGGFTRFRALGSWRSDDGEVICEAVYYYVVAVLIDNSVRTLHDLVADALRLAGEHSMFWRVNLKPTITIEVL